LPISELKIDLVPNIKGLKIKARRDIMSKILEGNWNTIFKGQGMEFSGYRPYSFGDDASKIDWSASLRAHDLLVRELEEFHNFNIFFMVDVSDSMLTSSTGKLKAEYTAEVTFSLCYSIMQSGDALGMGLFTDKLVAKVAPNLGKGSYYHIVKELTNAKNYGGKFDFVQALKYVSSFLKERSLVIIISDFLGLKKGWNRYLNILSGRYDIIGVMIRDPRDFKLPHAPGEYFVQDPYTDEKLLIDTKQYKKLYERESAKHEKFVRNSFEKSKLGFISLRTDRDYHQAIIDYFRKRMRVVK
jgi:uncharacterized protein (DUF58 family)